MVGQIVGNRVNQYAIFDLQRTCNGQGPHSAHEGVG